MFFSFALYLEKFMYINLKFYHDKWFCYCAKIFPSGCQNLKNFAYLCTIRDKSMRQITQQDHEFMREAIRLASDSVRHGGGPFGAVIVKDGKVIAGSSNRVTIDLDPTAHAEVNTIREACRRLGTFDLSGCTIYTSCEPCPMCLGAIYWAHIDRIYYGNTRKDARAVDFADDFIYEELDRPMNERTVPIIPLLRDEAQESFRLWTEKTDKTEY